MIFFMEFSMLKRGRVVKSKKHLTNNRLWKRKVRIFGWNVCLWFKSKYCLKSLRRFLSRYVLFVLKMMYWQFSCQCLCIWSFVRGVHRYSEECFESGNRPQCKIGLFVVVERSKPSEPLTTTLASNPVRKPASSTVYLDQTRSQYAEEPVWTGFQSDSDRFPVESFLYHGKLYRRQL